MDNKQKLMDILTNEVWQKSPKMVDYCMKKTAYIIPLDNEDIATIDKPDIETSFCFGYGYCGVSDEEDYQDAAKMASHARTNQDYFINENLKGINELLEALRSNDNKVYKFIHYNPSPDNSHLKEFTIIDKWTNPKEDIHYRYLRGFSECSDQERAEIIKGYEEVKTKFVKRLNTYLKRYGLSKIRSWAYLSD